MPFRALQNSLNLSKSASQPLELSDACLFQQHGAAQKMSGVFWLFAACRSAVVIDAEISGDTNARTRRQRSWRENLQGRRTPSVKVKGSGRRTLGSRRARSGSVRLRAAEASRFFLKPFPAIRVDQTPTSSGHP